LQHEKGIFYMSLKLEIIVDHNTPSELLIKYAEKLMLFAGHTLHTVEPVAARPAKATPVVQALPEAMGTGYHNIESTSQGGLRVTPAAEITTTSPTASTLAKTKRPATKKPSPSLPNEDTTKKPGVTAPPPPPPPAPPVQDADTAITGKYVIDRASEVFRTMKATREEMQGILQAHGVKDFIELDKVTDETTLTKILKDIEKKL
jgi:cell division septation protein DedD